MADLGPFPRRNLMAMLDEAHRATGPVHVAARETGTAQTVALPPLKVGRHVLSWVALHEHPPDAHWEETSFRSVVPWICEFSDVLVHGDAGIVCAGGEVVEDTLGQTSEMLHHYTNGPTGVTLHGGGPVVEVEGNCLSLLNFNYDNYFHWTLDTLGRLAAADSAALEACDTVLVPAFTTSFQRDGFARAGLARSHRLQVVPKNATLRVQRMLVPWSIIRDHRPHPCIVAYFNDLADGTAAATLPRRVYVDRRGSRHRRMVNEEELVLALAQLGFQPVALESLSLAEQIALFAQAEIIVSPHGAGLANIVYARPGCRVIEIHIDFWVNWCYRRLAAVFGVTYDCVVGRQTPGLQQEWVNARTWAVSVTHVMAAVESALTE